MSASGYLDASGAYVAVQPATPLPVTGSFTGVVSTLAQGTYPATAPTQAVLQGIQYLTAPPTLTNGQMGALQASTRGALLAQIVAANSITAVDTEVNNADARPTVAGASNMRTMNYIQNFNGSTYDRGRGDLGGTTVQTFAIQGNRTNYAAASGGILNSAAGVTAFAAAGASIRNFVTGIDLMAEALTNATEFVIRDGAGGTVLWRIKIPTTGLIATCFQFLSPLRGTANTLVEIQTITASGAGAVYANLHGFTQ